MASVLSITVFPQQIKITLSNLSVHRAALYSLNGEQINFIDSIFAERNAIFIYNANNLLTGFYQLRIKGKNPITFIFTGEEVDLKANEKILAKQLK